MLNLFKERKTKSFSTNGTEKLDKHMEKNKPEPNLIPYIHEMNYQPNIKDKTVKGWGNKKRNVFALLQRKIFLKIKEH